MNRVGRCLRNLLLLALVGWAGVDDYFPSADSAADSGAESGDYLLFDGAGCRRANAAEDFAPLAGCPRMKHKLSSAGVRIAGLDGRFHRIASPADHLYALMSLRR
jgi:hypothetical protein